MEFIQLSKEEILKILRRVCGFLLVLGYWQIAAMTMGGIFTTLHDTLDIFDVLYDAAKMPKLCLTGAEGAAAGTLISVFVLPVLYGSIIKGKNTKSSILQVLLWLPVIYFTESSTGYILFAVVTLVFLFLYFKNNARKKNVSLLLIALCIVLIVILSFPQQFVSLLPDEISENVEYLLIEKISDKENGSTVSRTVPFVTNWGAFTEYPLFGVGNGLQGYFYVKYFPDWAYGVAGSDVTEFLEVSKTGISNGGVFFPSLLSGYGIVGITAIIIFIISLLRHAKKGKEQMGVFYFTFIISCFAILVTGFQGDFYGKYYLWFMLSLPLMIKDDVAV